jgi:hypothetical protein
MIKRFLPYIGPLIGITGISLALYFHSQAVQERAPLYYVGLRSTIMDSSIATPSPLQVLYKGHPVGNANVVAAVVYFWNGGKMPIRAEDVLEPLSIELESSEILEARVLHVSRSVTKFEILPVAESSKNVLPVSFSILEKYDGGAVQIIYAGKSDATIRVHGTIVGAGMPRLFSEGRRVQSPEEARHKLEKAPLFLAVLGTAASILVLVALLWLRPKSVEYRSTNTKQLVVVGICLLLYLAVGSFIYFDTHRPEVPYSLVGK